MKVYFVDSWYLVALINRRDSAHQATRRIERDVSGSLLCTHDLVLAEVLNFFSEEGATFRQRAVQIARNLLNEPNFMVIESSRELMIQALDLYAARPDREYSLVDCMSMVTMRARGITHVLTNDHHFRQEGFVVVNDGE